MKRHTRRKIRKGGLRQSAFTPVKSRTAFEPTTTPSMRSLGPSLRALPVNLMGNNELPNTAKPLEPVKVYQASRTPSPVSSPVVLTTYNLNKNKRKPTFARINNTNRRGKASSVISLNRPQGEKMIALEASELIKPALIHPLQRFRTTNASRGSRSLPTNGGRHRTHRHRHTRKH
jgi:hypothetical protein